MEVEEQNAPETVVTVIDAPAGPEYITRGELDAIVAGLRLEFGQQVEDVAEVAVDALVTAGEAEATAEDASATADVALEVAVDAEQAAVTEEATEVEESGGPKGAQPRPEPEPETRREHYGSPMIYGRP